VSRYYQITSFFLLDSFHSVIPNLNQNAIINFRSLVILADYLELRLVVLFSSLVPFWDKNYTVLLLHIPVFVDNNYSNIPNFNNKSDKIEILSIQMAAGHCQWRCVNAPVKLARLCKDANESGVFQIFFLNLEWR
jgi:hypothetical protein